MKPEMEMHIKQNQTDSLPLEETVFVDGAKNAQLRLAQDKKEVSFIERSMGCKA